MSSPAAESDALPLPSQPMATPRSQSAPSRWPTAAGVTGLILSALGHTAFVIWGIGLWDMARPLQAAPPPSITVDLVPDPWKKREPPTTFDGSGSSASPSTSAAQSAPSPTAPPTPSSAAAPQPQSVAAPQPQSPPSPPTTPTPSPPVAATPQAQSAPPQSTAAPTMPAFPMASLPEPADIPADPDTPTATRIAQMLQLPVDLPNSSDGGGDPADESTKLAHSVVEQFKDRVRTCWTTPPDAVNDTRIKILMRVALRRDGRINGEPVLVMGIATPAGPAVVKSAIAALKQCQAYDFLPPDQYPQWRLLEIGFSAKGVE
jgi:hypothetical protein